MTATNKTLRDLNLEYWGRVHDMCEANLHNSIVQPWECVKYDGLEVNKHHPVFQGNLDKWQFALAILEGKPVFCGDELYHKEYGYEIIVEEMHKNLNPKLLSWTPPTKKRTFMLNGVELPCPDKENTGAKLDFFGVDYYFDDLKSINLVVMSINNLLTEARDKE